MNARPLKDDRLGCMRFAGQVNRDAIRWGFEVAKEGVTLAEIDHRIEEFILNAGCRPAFKGYQPEGMPSPFPATACISPNDIAVHGIPGDYTLRDGDLLTIDVGTEYNGWFVDSARSKVIWGNWGGPPGSHPNLQHKIKQSLIDATEAILAAELSVIRDGCDFLQIIEAAEAEAERYDAHIMPMWGGHQIGHKVHLPPFIPNALDRSQSTTKQKIDAKRYRREKLQSGQTICLEPVVTYGSGAIIVDEDQWTVRTADGLPVAHTERCLLVTENGYELLS